MLIIGGSINSSIPGMDEIIENRDDKELLAIVEYQINAGSDIIGINAGKRVDTEVDDIIWMLGVIQSAFQVPVCFDSSNPEVFKAGLELHNNSFGRPVVDSVCGNRSILDSLLPLVRKYEVPVVGLCMDENGVSEDPEARVAVADKIITAARSFGIIDSDILIDPIVQPLSVQSRSVTRYLDTLKLLKKKYPNIKVSCGLDNISFGLPAPELLNVFFLTMIKAEGQDAVIIKMNNGIKSILTVLDLMSGSDPFCEKYLESYRNNDFSFYQPEFFNFQGQKVEQL